MAKRIKIGDRVRVDGITTTVEKSGGEETINFDASKSDTGVVVGIYRSVPRAHKPKYYFVELDPPNRGIFVFYGTQNIEKLEGDK